MREHFSPEINRQREIAKVVWIENSEKNRKPIKVYREHGQFVAIIDLPKLKAVGKSKQSADMAVEVALNESANQTEDVWTVQYDRLDRVKPAE